MKSRPQSRGPIRVLTSLGSLLAIALCVAFAWMGAVPMEAQAVVHGLLCVGAGVAMMLPSRHLGRSGRMIPWGAASALVLATVCTALLPLPSAVVEVLSPGRTRGMPTTGGLVSLGAAPESTVDSIAGWILVLGFGLLVSTWASAHGRRRSSDWALVLGAGMLILSAFIHAALGAKMVFGVMQPITSPLRLLGPLVNQNHLGTAILISLPTAMISSYRFPPHRSLFGAVSLAVAVGGVITLFAVRSAGVWMAVTVVLLIFFRRRARTSVSVVVLFITATAVLPLCAVVWTATEPRWIVASLRPRLTQWSDTLWMMGEYPFTGVGSGAYLHAFPPYRSPGQFSRLAHVHSDILEWFAATGLLGAAALCAILWILWPSGVRDRLRAEPLELGLVGVGVASIVDFPLQIPAISAAFAGGLALRLALHQSHPPSLSPKTARLWLAVVMVAHAGAGVWSARSALAEDAVRQIQQFASRPDAAREALRRLQWTAPWRPDILLLEAWEAEVVGDDHIALERARTVATRYPRDPKALRQAALLMARNGSIDEAFLELGRAARRDPNDYRTWVVIARMALAEEDVERSLAAWERALVSAPPSRELLREAYGLLPVGLHWADVIEDSPAGTSMQFARMMHYERDWEAMRQSMEQAGRADPVRYAEHPSLAIALMNTGVPEEAEAYLLALLEKRPDDPHLWMAFGQVLASDGRYEEASEAYLNAAPLRWQARVYAVRYAQEHAGKAYALTVLHRLELAGHKDGWLGLEAARVQFRAGDPRGCLAEIDARALVQDREVGAEAERQAKKCRAMLSRAREQTP